MTVKIYALRALLAGTLVLCGLPSCAQHTGSETPAANPAAQPSQEQDKKQISPEQKQFQDKVAAPAELFSKKSQEIYTSDRDQKKPWWAILWPWGQEKKSENPKMDLKKFEFSATYPNAK
jgi:hypothetical protein